MHGGFSAITTSLTVCVMSGRHIPNKTSKNKHDGLPRSFVFLGGGDIYTFTHSDYRVNFTTNK